MPPPTISIFEAFDLKRDYLQKIFARLDVPSLHDIYIDTESLMGTEGNAARNVYEWSMLEVHEDGAHEWHALRNGVQQVSSTKIGEWAVKINKIVKNKIVVAYGSARPEYHRIRSFQDVLPYKKRSDFTYFDVHLEVVKQLFTCDPKDELNPKAKIYLPYFNQEYIYRHLNKSPVGIYCGWPFPASSKDCPSPGKSAFDVMCLYNLVHAFACAKEGYRFKHPLPAFRKKKSEIMN